MASCKGCGLSGCSWMRDGKKWKLLAPDGSHHKCQLYRPAKPLAVLEIRKGPRVVGSNYSPSCGQCDVPPWEVCACSFAEVNSDVKDSTNTEAAKQFQRMLDLAETA